MLEQLLQWDQEIFLQLNGLGSPWLDGLMLFLSYKFVWIPLYLYLIYRLYRQNGNHFYIPLLLLILTITLTDQTTSSLMKPFFERLRPCKNPSLDGLVQVIGNCTGKYGFASGHAANSFGLASFFFFYEKRSTMSKGLLIWAGLVAYSRVYLGVHYVGDILAGGLIGLSAAWLLVRLAERSLKSFRVN